MRVAVLILLFANLAFLAWAVWIDTPPTAVASVTSSLPKLVLASEADSRRPAAASAKPSESASRCVSVGPFSSEERAAGAVSVLRGRGYSPRRHEGEGETRDGYWVYVAGLQSDAAEARVMRTLSQAGLEDARIMPDSQAGRRISVGLFSERSRAERRARALRRLGLEPEIGERRVPGTVFWLDLDLGPDDSSLSTDGLLDAEEADSRLEVRACGARAEPAGR